MDILGYIGLVFCFEMCFMQLYTKRLLKLVSGDCRVLKRFKWGLRLLKIETRASDNSNSYFSNKLQSTRL